MTQAGAQGAPGWYPDPWRVAPWRWWDGTAWSAVTHGSSVPMTTSSAGAAKKPRLPAWLSPPVVVCGVLMGLYSALLALAAPVAVLLGFVPLVIVLPVLHWLDRVEPEPRAARLHAVLWGATVATFMAIVINSIVAVVAGDTVAAVVSAPVVEEAGKALAIIWAVRRREVDSVMDGIVYAGWAALGFAVVEDFLYFSTAAQEGTLVGVFVVRALLTPFAHPLFTAWIGIAIGRAVQRGRPLRTAWWGYGLAVGAHAAWNGSLALAGSDGDGGTNDGGGEVIAVAALGFVLLFVAVVIALVRLRRAEQRRFEAAIPAMAGRYGLTPAELAVFGSWNGLLRTRRSLPRHDRRRFDALHAALARLATLQQRLGEDPVMEERLVMKLDDARRSKA